MPTGFWRRLRTLLLWLVGGWLALTAGSVLALRWLHPLTSAFILESYAGAWLAHDFRWRAEHEWTPYARISTHLKLAVIASEDQKFAFHPGFDFEAIDAALRERERGRRLRGASTISQQVAKNLFLWPGPNLLRKGLEAYLTALIELLWPKQRILEVYLNLAEFGPGVYGVGAAARHYFQTEPARLTPTQSARLAAVLPSPKRLHVERPSGYLQRREAWILEQMRALGGASYLHEFDSAHP